MWSVNKSTDQFEPTRQQTTIKVSNSPENTMVSLRFPFLFSQPATTRVPSGAFSPANIACSVAVSAAIGAGISAGICLSQNTTSPSLHNALNSLLSNFSRSSPLWGSLSLSDGSGDVVTESKTGFSFPAVLKDSQGLLGIGLRRKAVFGLKNIDVYAFGNLILEIFCSISNVFTWISMPFVSFRNFKFSDRKPKKEHWTPYWFSFS